MCVLYFPLKKVSSQPQLTEQNPVLFKDYSWNTVVLTSMQRGKVFCHVQAIWPSSRRISSWIRWSIWYFPCELAAYFEGGQQCCVHLPSLTKVCLSVIPFTAKFTQEWQRQVLLGLPDTCAPTSRSLQVNIQRRKSPGLQRRGWVRQTQPKLGGFSSKPAGLALFYRNFFTCQFDQQSPQQVLTGATSWRSRRRALVSFNRENDFKIILKSLELFCLPQHWVIQLPARGYAHKAFFKRKQISFVACFAFYLIRCLILASLAKKSFLKVTGYL